MKGGKLRRRITIQQPTLAQNATGEMTPTWTSFAANLPAEIVPSNGKEVIQADQINAQQPILVRIRYLSGLLPKMRLVYGARTFEIQSVANIEERNREMELTCLEHQ